MIKVAITNLAKSLHWCISVYLLASVVKRLDNTYPLGISLFLLLERPSKAPSILRQKNSKTHSTPDRFKIKTITVLLGFVSRETRTRIVHGCRDIQPRSQGFSLEGGRERGCVASLISKSSIFKKCFPSKLKRKADVFKFLWFEERFRKSSQTS